MSHDDCTCHDRRELLKKGALGLTAGFMGLGMLSRLFVQEAYGITPDAATQKYDAVIQIFYDGGPSQTDTWDPKPGSTSNVFNTINLGAQDIYGKTIYISEVFPKLATAVMNDPAIKLGIVRSMTHGNGDHGTAQSWMNCYWQSPVSTVYPSTAAAMAYYFQNQGIGVPSVLIRGSNGEDANNPKGSDCPTALQVFDTNTTVQMLKTPTNVDATRYQRRRSLMEAFNSTFMGTHPDASAKAWDNAWKQAYDITTNGQAAAAFDLTGKTILPGGTNAQGYILRNMTLAQELVKAGIPYVALGIGGNDSHDNNRQTIMDNWGGMTDVPLAQMAMNLKATGKRVLVIMGGEFGRTPDSVKPDSNGVIRDGRDHWGSGFSWSMLSINQPAFKMTAVGNTGPDGTWTRGSSTPLVDPVEPGALGTLVYRSLGFPIGSDPKWNIPTAIGSRLPVDPAIASSTVSGGGTWLMQKFGLA